MTTLAELCELITDCEHKTAPIQDEGYPSIRTPNIGRGRFLLDGVNRVSEATYQAWTKRAVPAAGDLILAREAPVGNVAVIPKGEQFCLGQRTVLIRPKGDLVDSDYLCYLLLTAKLQAQLHGKSGGATVHHLNMKDIRALEMPEMPAIDVQRCVAQVIKNYDDLIETNQRRIALLEQAARLLYREWFVHLRFPGHESVTVKDGVPEGWQPSIFSELVAVNPRTRFEKDQLRPFVDMAALSESSMVIGERVQRHITGGAKFKNGDTLFARITPCIQNGKTGFVQFLEDDDSVASGSTEFIVFRSIKVNPWWVYCISREDDFRQHAINSMAGSDGRQRVNPKCFDQYAVLQPPTTVLDQFEAVVKDLFSQVENLCKANLELANARDLLLPKLMSGQLDVSQISLPEEAEASN
ncbi:restriction endonuclease subunit S [Comamonas aquatica]|uniref:restriction endonuclease subunit S n=1 Tax=Comamonas aquatica TaxID=225991 RepID=UPI002447C0F6|nr:restriction endonuclease subunit S [Comamonas aquatica]MDH0382370.1 restriction endonuclease subunit S [Comamonas aquatica]MDH0430507.1 restriction endonuclease subunit S [Comamonas aquatica]MDH0941441.1 restriction endonuclease subunit S [Comamonas aquatica]